MIISKSIFINIFIAINIMYLLLYGYNKYIWSPKIADEIYNKRVTSIISSELTSIPPVLKLKYGDIVDNHTLIDVLGNNINISNNSKFYNYLYFMKAIDPNKLKIDDLSYIIELNKQIIEEYKSKIRFISIIVGDSSNIEYEYLKKMEKRLNISIVYLTNENVSNFYNISNWGCSYCILLNTENRVVYSFYPVPVKYLSDIIIRELHKY